MGYVSTELAGTPTPRTSGRRPEGGRHTRPLRLWRIDTCVLTTGDVPPDLSRVSPCRLHED